MNEHYYITSHVLYESTSLIDSVVADILLPKDARVLLFSVEGPLFLITIQEQFNYSNIEFEERRFRIVKAGTKYMGKIPESTYIHNFKGIWFLFDYSKRGN